MGQIIPSQVIKVWEKWELTLSLKIKVLRSIPSPDTLLNVIDILLFPSSNITGTWAAAYAVTNQITDSK